METGQDMKTDSDASIVKASLAGDRNAFGALVEKYEKRLFNTALRIVGDAEDAMDATQSAFVKMYEKLGTYNSDYRFFSWAYRTLLNESINIVKRRRPLERLDDSLEAGSKNPEEQYRETEASRHMDEALLELETGERTVIVLKHFQHLSYREMSEIIGIPEKTIKSRLFTARRRLRSVILGKGLLR